LGSRKDLVSKWEKYPLGRGNLFRKIEKGENNYPNNPPKSLRKKNYGNLQDLRFLQIQTPYKSGENFNFILVCKLLAFCV
jgi:hypothetical protein